MLQSMGSPAAAAAAAAAKSLQSCLTLCDPIDGSPLGSEARRGSQGASRAAPGKSGLHARGKGERVMVLVA